MEVFFYPNGQTFLEDFRELLSHYRIETCFFKGNANSIDSFSIKNFCIAVKDEDKVLLAVEKAPYNMLLFGNVDLVEPLAKAIFSHNLCVNGLLCVPELGEAFYKCYNSLTIGSYQKKLSMDMMQTKTKADVEKVTLTSFLDTDLEELKELISYFYLEALDGAPNDMEDKLKDTISCFRGLKIDGRFVSIAKKSREDEEKCSVTLVYTRKEYRGKGLSKKVVGNITNEIIENGKVAYLFVDKKNPISNHLYSSLGYEYLKPQTEFMTIPGNIKTAYFAGGCFWCISNAFNDIEGIKGVISGYMGDTLINPTYELVKSGSTNYRETIGILYDEQEISYQKLLNVFFSSIDPFDNTGQFIDKGTNYLSGVFTSNETEIELFKKTVLSIEEKTKKQVCVDLLPLNVFYPAEEEHQDYAVKNPEAFEEEFEISGRKEYSFLKVE